MGLALAAVRPHRHHHHPAASQLRRVSDKPDTQTGRQAGRRCEARRGKTQRSDAKARMRARLSACVCARVIVGRDSRLTRYCVIRFEAGADKIRRVGWEATAVASAITFAII